MLAAMESEIPQVERSISNADGIPAGTTTEDVVHVSAGGGDGARAELGRNRPGSRAGRE